ncbi:MAG: response regulator, partial [Deltaproteobacteria bacterium]|nr:response regulator [Deltaproteobacteria bacterium]
SSGGEPVKEIVPIGEFVKDSVFSTLRDADIDCDFSILDDLYPIEIDEAQMKQVIRNIVINAQEAMGGEGKIKVCCENVVCEAEKTPTLKEGKYVRVSIEDKGAGIPKENIAKISDPYFSTKEMGAEKGQGLGLAISHSIVEKHDGLITVESELGKGTNISIYLLASEKEKVELAPLKKPAEKRPVIGKGKILLMDDEETVRNVSAAMLKKLGYKLELAVDGLEAIEKYKKARDSGRPFDAVILDLTNQFGMGGLEAVKGLLAIDPHVKAIVSTGYSNDPVVTDFRRYGFCGALPKPYTMDALSKGLKEALGIED